MPLSSIAKVSGIFLLAGAASLTTASQAVKLIEASSEINVRAALDSAELHWAEVEANGLRVVVAGVAPDEAHRFRALSAAGSEVDAARVIDQMTVKAVADLAAPRFSAEILRNDAGLSIIGLLPSETDRDTLSDQIADIAGDATFSKLIETADYAPPEGWEDALGFALMAVERLQRAKISVEAGRVAITGNVDSPEEKSEIERALYRSAPPGLQVSISLTAPRPVITPFTLRFVIDETGARFDACSADTERTAARILEAAWQAGAESATTCRIGLGVPSPDWADAAIQVVDALAQIGAGTVTIADADITLIAAEGTSEAAFERAVGELENTLPDVFALYSKRTATATPEDGPPEFVATLSPEGLVQLRGRLPNENLRDIARSYAQAAFGADAVHTAARLAEDLPQDWPLRVLTGLEGLSQLTNGALTVTPDLVRISGATGDPDASARIAGLLADKLGEAEAFEIAVEYREQLDPVASLPTPEECEMEITAITRASKITFEPGSATIDSSALGTIDDIAAVLRECGEVRLEIQGHTDSQGREIMNLNLSQARAESVLNELRARRVLTSTFVAKGYGETAPIADNETEVGREANRRIEFRLIRPEPTAAEGESTLDSVAASGDIEDTATETSAGTGEQGDE